MGYGGIDTDGDGKVTIEEFAIAVKDNVDLRECLDKIGLTPRCAEELFSILDLDGNGGVTAHEFMEGCAKLKGTIARDQDFFAMCAGVRSLLRDVRELQDGLAQEKAQLRKEREELKKEWRQFQTMHAKGHAELLAALKGRSASMETMEACAVESDT